MGVGGLPCQLDRVRIPGGPAAGPSEIAGWLGLTQSDFFPLGLIAAQGGVMRPLKWSQNQAGTLNGKVGHVTLFTVVYYPERGHFVNPKLPGLNKTISVSSKEEGKIKAEALYERYVDFLNGARQYLVKNLTR
jgi:hypothetical protein